MIVDDWQEVKENQMLNIYEGEKAEEFEKQFTE